MAGPSPRRSSAGIRSAHQFFTYAVSTPLQHGTVAALHAPESYFTDFVADYRRRRDRLCGALDAAGFTTYVPAGTYFVLADHTGFDLGDDVAFCRHLIEHVGVAAIPPSTPSTARLMAAEISFDSHSARPTRCWTPRSTGSLSYAELRQPP